MKKISMVFFFIILLTGLVFAGILATEITDDSTISKDTTSITICKDSTCSTTPNRLIYDGGTFKPVAQVANLKGTIFEQLNIETDKNYVIAVNKFNSTYISMNLSTPLTAVQTIGEDGRISTQSLIIPIKIWRPNLTKNTLTGNFKQDYDLITDEKIDFTKTKKVTKAYSFGLDDIIEFGATSTTIKINSPNEVDDDELNQNQPDYNYGTSIAMWIVNSTNSTGSYNRELFMRFNLTNHYSSTQIQDAKICMYCYQNDLDYVTEGFNITTYLVYNNFTVDGDSWIEGDSLSDVASPGEMRWNATNMTFVRNPPETRTKIAGGIGRINDEWLCINVTNSIIYAYSQNYKNATFWMRADSSFGSPQPINDYIRFFTSNYNADPTARPYLNITFSDTTVIIDSPEPKSYNYNMSLNLNYSIKNYSAMDTCKYWVFNSTNGYEISNTTLTGCTNTTINVSKSDTYTLGMFVNDTFNYIGEDSVIFAVSMDAPAIVLDYPSDESWFKNGTSIYFNYTATDSDGLSTCKLYSNWTGTWGVNQTWVNPESGKMNYTIKNLTEGRFLWNVWCNDTTAEEIFAVSNFTVGIDLTKPFMNISNILTNENSQTIYFNHTSSDSLSGLSSCWYAIYNMSGGVDGLNNNISVTCGNAWITATTTNYNDFYLYIYGKDNANNENYSMKEFETRQSSVISGNAGGSIILTGGKILQNLLTTNYSIVTSNDKNVMDISLAKDSVKPRQKEFYIINRAKEPITLYLLCDTQTNNVTTNESNKINICDYVEILNKTITVSPNEQERTMGEFLVYTPQNVSFGNQFYFNILAVRGLDSNYSEYAEYSKLSVGTRISFLSTIFYKWKFLPYQEGEDKDKKAYPTFPFALFVSFLSFAVVFMVFRTFKLFLSGFFLGIISLLTLLSLLVIVL